MIRKPLAVIVHLPNAISDSIALDLERYFAVGPVITDAAVLNFAGPPNDLDTDDIANRLCALLESRLDCLLKPMR